MSIAVIKTGGKQYKVSEGDVLKVEKIGQEKVELKDLLNGKKVTASVLKNIRAKKVRILKFRPKKHYRRENGHRQELSEIKIESIK